MVALEQALVSLPQWRAHVNGEHPHIGGATSTRRLLSMGGIVRGERVLNIDCFVGGTARILAIERECRVVGTDPSVECLNLARAQGPARKISYVAGLGVRDGAFDAVVVEDSPVQLSVVHRLLRRGGRFVLQGSVDGILREAVQAYRDYGFESWWSEDITEEATGGFRRWRNGFAASQADYVGRFGEAEFRRQLENLEERLIRPYENGSLHHIRAVFTKEGPIHKRRLLARSSGRA
jgi:SAM-dependent methyltransferase